MSIVAAPPPSAPTAAPAVPSPLPPAVWSPPAVPTLPMRRFSVDEYDRMIEVGILTSDERIELIRGWLIPQMSKNLPHIAGTRRARKQFARLQLVGCFLDIQDPIRLLDSKPEPDLMVVRGGEEQFDKRAILPADVALILEVADSSIEFDRTWKLVMYAEAGIRAYWIINLADHCVEVFDDPTGPAPEPAYRSQQTFKPGDSVPVVIDGHEVGRVAVNDLLP